MVIKMGYVYLISNDINNKKYVGITIRTIEQRWKEHLRHDNEIIDKAIKKYGANHFFIQQLEECSDEELDNKEQYWISYYDSYKNGYNCTTGGRRQFNMGSNKNHERIKELWELGFGQKEIQQKTGLNIETVHNYLIKSGVSSEDIKARFKQKLSKAKSIPVKQLDLDNNLIKIWDSAKEASEFLNISRQNICLACKKKRKTAGNYKWEYLGE